MRARGDWSGAASPVAVERESPKRPRAHVTETTTSEAAPALARDRAPAGSADLDWSAGRLADAGPDAPVRVEAAMPRDLFDRLTAHDQAPRCRYEIASGRAEFVAEPTFAHESRAATAGELFTRVAVALEAVGASVEMQVSRATRLLSDDGAFEPDEGLFVGAEKIAAAERVGGWLDVRRGHPAPDLVVEIDRSTRSSRKLVPYFRMGVREAWTWSRRDGAAIWIAGDEPREPVRRAAASRVLPGATRDALDALFGSPSRSERMLAMRRLARRVARELIVAAASAPASDASA